MATPLAVPSGAEERIAQTEQLLSAEQQKVESNIGGDIREIRRLQQELFNMTGGKKGVNHQGIQEPKLAA